MLDLLNEYSLDVENPEKNLKLALEYDKLGHTASAISFYLRASERFNDKEMIYVSLLRMALCFEKQGNREQTVKGIYNQAITVLPKRPEAYYLLSKTYRRSGLYHESYTTIEMCLENCNFNLRELDYDVNYFGYCGLIFEKAISSWWWGKIDTCKECLSCLRDEYWNSLSFENKKDLEEYFKYTDMDMEIEITKRKIIDCFRFFNEKELLELRYHILKDKVDKFIILQGDKTQSGNPTELLAEKYIEELNFPKDKFTVVNVNLPGNDEYIENREEDIIFRQLSGPSSDSYQNSLNARSRERILLDSLLNVVSDYNDNDVFLVSDCDEIIKPEYVDWFSDMAIQYSQSLIKVPLIELQGRADLRAYDKEKYQPISTDNVFFICTKKHFEKCSPFRMRFNINNPFEVVYVTENNARVEECGWHFSWMGNTEKLKLKQKSTSHYADQIESAIIKDMSSRELEEYIDNWKPEDGGLNPWGNTNTILKKYPKEKLPKELFEFDHLEKFFLSDSIKCSEVKILKDSCVKKNNSLNTVKPKVIDSFIFFNEFDMLKLRLNYLNDVVDYFVISECNYTFSGNSKPYYLDEIWNDIPEDIRNKIIRLKYELDISQYHFSNDVKEYDPENDNWKIERGQRNYISLNLNNFDDNDIFILNDVDEIPRKEVIQKFIDKEIDTDFPCVLETDFFYYNFSSINNIKWPGSVITSIKIAKEKGCEYIRKNRVNFDSIKNGGWHFSYFGNINHIQNKIKSFSHQEYNKEEFISEVNLSDKIKNKKDIFNRNQILQDYNFDNFPKNLQKNIKEIFSTEYYKEKLTDLPIPVLGVPIVNGVNWLKRLIDSVDYPIKELFIVNNNGRDQITDELNEITKINHPFIEKIKVCHLPHNIGVGGSWNLIIKSYIMSPYWIICNSDVSFTPGFLKEMVEKSMNGDIEIVWPPSINSDYVSNGLGSFECFLLKDSVIQKCGLFDENLYPAYCEDCDYLVKIKSNNIKSEYVFSPFYHGETQSYETGSQTLKIESQGVREKIQRAHMLNIQYMSDKWGNDWENWKNYHGLCNVKENKTYDLYFNRKKYLGF